MSLGIFNESADDQRGQEIFRAMAYSPEKLRDIYRRLNPEEPEPKPEDILVVAFNNRGTKTEERCFVSFKVHNEVTIVSETFDFENPLDMPDILQMSKKTLFHLFQFLRFDQVRDLRFRLVMLVRPTTQLSEEDIAMAKSYMRQFPFEMRVDFLQYPDGQGEGAVGEFFDSHRRRVKVANILGVVEVPEEQESE